MDRQKDGQTDGRTDGQTDTPIFFFFDETYSGEKIFSLAQSLMWSLYDSLGSHNKHDSLKSYYLFLKQV